MAERFQHWFPVSRTEFADISVSTCNATLQAFVDGYRSSSDQIAINLGIGHYNVYQLCKDHASCILSNSSQWSQANLGTTTLVLGLLPTILAVIAPSMTEMAVLGVHRSVLSTILVVSSPAVLQARVFDYVDPGEVLATEYRRQDVRYPLTIGPWSKNLSLLAGAGGYLLAFGSLVNTLTLVIQLSNSSVLSWGCTRTWPLYVWMFVPAVIHWLASTGYHFTLQKAKRTGANASEPGDEIPLQPIVDHGKSDDSHRNPTHHVDEPYHSSDPSDQAPDTLRRRVLSQTASCASHVHTRFQSRSRDAFGQKLQVGVILNSTAGFLGFLHIIFATVTFSGLLFIVPLDAIGQVAMRLMLSALVCRLVAMFEIAGLRGWSLEYEEKEELEQARLRK